MLIASVLTLIRIRTSRNHVGNLMHQRIQYQTIDRHLITMMFFQVDISLFLTLFRSALLTYGLLTGNMIKNTYRVIIEVFLDQLTLNI